MPDSKDPDEYINKHGPERVSAGCWIGSGATRHTDWTRRAQYDLEIGGRAAYLKEAVQIRIASQPMEREIYVSRLAQQTEVTADVIKLKFRVYGTEEKQQKKQEFRAERDRSRRERPAESGQAPAPESGQRRKRDCSQFDEASDRLPQLNPAVGPDDFVTDF